MVENCQNLGELNLGHLFIARNPGFISRRLRTVGRPSAAQNRIVVRFCSNGILGGGRIRCTEFLLPGCNATETGVAGFLSKTCPFMH
jgi:hypothetical protein